METDFKINIKVKKIVNALSGPAPYRRYRNPLITQEMGYPRLSRRVNKIIKEHASCIKINSDPGEGTAFRVMLPVKNDEDHQTETVVK